MQAPEDRAVAYDIGSSPCVNFHNFYATIPAMARPMFPSDAPPGPSAYPTSPVVNDSVNRGVLRGRRVDTVAVACRDCKIVSTQN
jgi:hypothetical protein